MRPLTGREFYLLSVMVDGPGLDDVTDDDAAVHDGLVRDGFATHTVRYEPFDDEHEWECDVWEVTQEGEMAVRAHRAFLRGAA